MNGPLHYIWRRTKNVFIRPWRRQSLKCLLIFLLLPFLALFAWLRLSNRSQAVDDELDWLLDYDQHHVIGPSSKSSQSASSSTKSSQSAPPMLLKRHLELTNQLVSGSGKAEFVKSRDSMSCIRARTEPSFVVCVCLHDPRQELVAKIVIVGGKWETLITQWLAKYLPKFPTAYFVDIGASFGFHSLYTAALGRNVIALEHRSHFVEQIKASVEENPFPKEKISILNRCLYHEPRPGLDQGPVPASQCNMTLNELALLMPAGTTALMRTNVEGFEPQVFTKEKAGLFFQRINVPFLLMTWGKQAPPRDVEAMLNFLYDLGFRPFQMMEPFQELDREFTRKWPVFVVWSRGGPVSL